MKHKVIISVLFCILAAGLVAVIVFCDSAMMRTVGINLNGEPTVNVEVFSQFSDPGCNAEYGSDISGYKKIDYTTEGTVDTNIPGSYTITYKTEADGKTATVTRVVNVADTTPPVIECSEKITAFTGDTQFKVKYTASDNLDGDVTAAVSSTNHKSSVTLSVTDNSGNTATREIKVEFVDDTVAPKLTLKGAIAMYVRAGTPFAEPGYTATDNRDGNVTGKVAVIGNLDTNTDGTYELTYTVSDANGNTATSKRTVMVFTAAPAVAAASGGTPIIYLTFDDGPCIYTPKLLDTLKYYDVKATFFVTNQAPAYQSLIAREYAEGHAIGVHTLTHQWSLYDSIENYMNDFNAMNEIIKISTGQYSKIFRFPGGSSNLTSKTHCSGIMTALSSKMQELGYVEFDWNVSGGDTIFNTPTQVANEVITHLRSGANVVLLHDIKPYTVNAVPAIIEYGMSHGYTFGTLSEQVPPVRHTVAN